MKALTLWQPWASLVACGAKTIETRSWSTAYRGPLAVHAAATTKGFDTLPGDCEGTTEAGWRYGYVGDFQAGYCYRTSDEGTRGDTFLTNLAGSARGPLGLGDPPCPLGAVVATCSLVDVVPVTDVVFYGNTLTLLGAPWVKCPAIDDDPAYVEVDHAQEPLGDFTPGRYAWLLDDVQALPEPVPARGRQQLWEWTP